MGAHARVTYAAWVEHAKTRGEIAPSVPTTVAAAFIDTQFVASCAPAQFPRLRRLGEAHDDGKVVGGGATPLAPIKAN